MVADIIDEDEVPEEFDNIFFVFFFSAEDGIRDGHVTGVQTCALPIWARTIVSSVSRIFTQSRSLLSPLRCFDRFREASVQTAVESGRLGIEISVQRLELLNTL